MGSVNMIGECVYFAEEINKLLVSVLKADRKRLKAEKYDLLNQMKELYATLDDKEKELRDFIRNYDKVRK
jgi:catalase (peroxidase I)